MPFLTIVSIWKGSLDISVRSPLRPSAQSLAASQVLQQRCSQRYSFPSMIMMQLHRPPTFQPFPHQQQFQQRLRISNGQSGSGHFGTARWSKPGGGGYETLWQDKFVQGFRSLPFLVPWASFLEDEGDGEGGGAAPQYVICVWTCSQASLYVIWLHMTCRGSGGSSLCAVCSWSVCVMILKCGDLYLLVLFSRI